LDNKFLDVSIEFGDQLIKYLRHFGLIEADIARLVKSNTDDIREILDGQKGVVLKTAEKISNAFGLRYFELGNPKFPLPKIKQLPEETQDAIKYRKEKGTAQIVRNYDNDIAGNLDRIIYETDLLHQPVTAEEIRLHFPEDIRDTIKATRITDLLKKSGRDQLVIQVDKKGREHLFQLKEFVGK
jgi:hypothetical protein